MRPEKSDHRFGHHLDLRPRGAMMKQLSSRHHHGSVATLNLNFYLFTLKMAFLLFQIFFFIRCCSHDYLFASLEKIITSRVLDKKMRICFYLEQWLCALEKKSVIRIHAWPFVSRHLARFRFFLLKRVKLILNILLNSI